MGELVFILSLRFFGSAQAGFLRPGKLRDFDVAVTNEGMYCDTVITDSQRGLRSKNKKSHWPRHES
jgi:hypothetical protein